MKVTGRCHCGELVFDAVIDPEKTMICHCTAFLFLLQVHIFSISNSRKMHITNAQTAFWQL